MSKVLFEINKIKNIYMTNEQAETTYEKECPIEWDIDGIVGHRINFSEWLEENKIKIM